MIAHAAVVGRNGGDARQAHAFACQADDDMIVRQRPVRQRGHPFLPRVARLHPQRPATVMFQRERNGGMCHCETTDDVETGGIFRLGRSQEFAAGGHLGEKLFDGDAGAGRQGGWPLRHQLPIVDRAVPALPALPPAVDRQARDTGDGRQRFATETQSGHIFNGIVIGHLGCRVPLQRQRHVGRIHADTVVAHLDPVESAVRQADGDASRASVQRIFNNVLERAGGSFNHFTGSDTIDQMFGQAAY